MCTAFPDRVLPLIAALDRLGIPTILTRHEQGASYMADVDARIIGMAVVVTTSGPGAINALGGAAAARMDSVPLLVITAQAERAEFGRYGIQEGTGIGRTPDVSAMFAATAKNSIRPSSARELAPNAAKALRTAREGRPGPVHLDVPSDLLTQPVAGRSLPMELAVGPTNTTGRGRTEPELELVAEAARRIAAARRPLLLAGGGLATPAGAEALRGLAEGADLPVVCTVQGKRLVDERHELVLGPVGVYRRLRMSRSTRRLTWCWPSECPSPT